MDKNNSVDAEIEIVRTQMESQIIICDHPSKLSASIDDELNLLGQLKGRSQQLFFKLELLLIV